MRDILPDIKEWVAARESIALASVVQTWGSSPRPAGAYMGMTSAGKITGSVSGGCVESAVIEVGIEVIKTGLPQLLHFGVADETAWDVGLACGGEIDVFVQPLDNTTFDFIREALEGEQPTAIATVINGPQEKLGLAIIATPRNSFEKAGGSISGIVLPVLKDSLNQSSKPKRLEIKNQGIDIFVNPIPPSPTLVIIGGVHIAIALTRLAKPLGYHTIVIDPRRAFGSETRFPHVDQLLQVWPDEALKQFDIASSTAFVTLTHDPKIDDPALVAALNSSAFYIGALGSRTTQAKRKKRLAQAGFSEDELKRIHGPVGLDIGAATPEEIALSIIAEVVAASHADSN